MHRLVDRGAARLGGGVAVMVTLWAAKWSRTTKLDGHHEHLILFDWRTPSLQLFRTRAECRAWIEERYGYVRKRKDLQREPHHWRMPRAVRVKVEEVHR